MSGHEVRWQKWALRVGFNPREGLVLNTVTYDGRPCSIAGRSPRCSFPTPTPRSPPTARTPSTWASTASA